MRRGKWTAVAAMAATVAMVTAACGSSGGGTGGTSGGTTPATSQQQSQSSSEAPPSSETGGGSSSAMPPSSETGGGSSSGAPSTSGSGGGATGAAFKFGYVLPETGDLAYLGPPQIEAMKYAISLINKAGGINDQQVGAPMAGDEANNAALAAQAATKEINAHVNAIIGAAATGMTMAIIDKVTAAGIAECSGSNTGVNLTDYKGKMGPGGEQYYFRTAPSDALQGPILGNLIVSDGHSQVAIMARGDDYGKGLAKATADAITAAGGTVVYNQAYDPNTTDFSGIVQAVKAKNPDAIVTISFDEGWQLLKGLFAAGLTPDKVGVYGADGMSSTTAPGETWKSDPSIVDGMKGTAPASVDNQAFTDALKAFAPKLKEQQFAPQVFDCTNIFALAAEQAKSNNAQDWVKYVDGITKDGTKCTTYAECKQLIDAGTDIQYVGASGDLSFTDHGEPGKATIQIYEYHDGGKFKVTGTKLSQIGG